MNHNIEWTTTNCGAPAIIFQQQKYRQRCISKDETQLLVCCNKCCGVLHRLSLHKYIPTNNN